MPDISVIIPIYNAEKYLQRCLDSILNQTFKNIEIILINDGSTDSSISICNKYKKMDSRVRVIDKKNEGVSKARNLGLSYAIGKYIMFIDADDHIELNMMESLYKTITDNRADMCFCNYINESSLGKEYVEADLDKVIQGRDEVRKKIICRFIEKDDNEGCHNLARFRCPWGKIFKKEIIDKYDVSFNEELKIGEDFLFNLQFLIHAQKVCLNDGYYYHYINNDNSAMAKYRKNCWENNYQKLINNLKDFLVENNLYEEPGMKVKMDRLIIKYFFACIYNERKAGNSTGRKKTLKNLCSQSLIKKASKTVSLSEYGFREAVILILTRCGMASLVHLVS